MGNSRSIGVGSCVMVQDAKSLEGKLGQMVECLEFKLILKGLDLISLPSFLG